MVRPILGSEGAKIRNSSNSESSLSNRAAPEPMSSPAVHKCSFLEFTDFRVTARLCDRLDQLIDPVFFEVFRDVIRIAKSTVLANNACDFKHNSSACGTAKKRIDKPANCQPYAAKITGRGARLGPPDQKIPASEPRLIDKDIHLRARIRFAIAKPSVWGVTVATTADYNSYLNEQRKHGAIYLQFNVPGAVKRV